ncbi:MAG: helix-turn-helix transcriptional regulator [Oscillospiraceae bacterium]|nr:helix-turn-helix transcriptional regulator [Oscillospiraceae bacterium]
MSKVVSFEHRDRFIQLGIAISTLRKIRGMSQDKLAEKAHVCRSVISTIEAPNSARNFTVEVLFSIADALDISPADLLNASVFPDNVIKNEKGLLTDSKLNEE